MKPLFSVKVRVPATSANLGPGFDVLGLALAHYNDVSLTGRSSGPRLVIVNEGEGAAALPRDGRHLLYRAAAKTFRALGKPLPPSLELRLMNRIALARGMGSSSAAIVGGVVAADAACGGKLSREEMAQLATDMEGHPDNVVPALAGGLCASAVAGGRVAFLAWKDRKIFQGMKAVVAVPDFELSTAKARAVLPKTVSRADAVFNASRVALFLSALAAGRRDLLGLAMEDRLHQPYRAKLVPGLSGAVAGAWEAGAFGAALSGAGPCVLALAPAAKAVAAGRAMQAAFKKRRVSSRVLVLDVDFDGAKVLK